MIQGSGFLISKVVLAIGLCVPDTVPTLPLQFSGFRDQAAKAESVVRAKELRRSSVFDPTPMVYLEVVEQIAGKPIEGEIVVAASAWDAVAPYPPRRDSTTFLLNMRNREEIMCIQLNGVPTRHNACAGMLPVVDDSIPASYAKDYDLYSCDESIPMWFVRAELSRKPGK